MNDYTRTQHIIVVTRNMPPWSDGKTRPPDIIVGTGRRRDESIMDHLGAQLIRDDGDNFEYRIRYNDSVERVLDKLAEIGFNVVTATQDATSKTWTCVRPARK